MRLDQLALAYQSLSRASLAVERREWYYSVSDATEMYRSTRQSFRFGMTVSLHKVGIRLVSI